MKQKTTMVIGQTVRKGFAKTVLGAKARRLGVAVVGASLAFALMAPASAGFELRIDWGNNSWNSDKKIQGENSMKETLFDGGGTMNIGQIGNKDWTLHSMFTSYTHNPSQTNAFTFTNNTGVTNTFIVTIITPAMIEGPTFLSGSITGGLTDNSPFTGATFTSAAESSVYTALIDGVAVQTLWDHPFSVTSVHPSVATLGLAAFQDVPGPGVMSSIAITHEFTLSAGDSVTINSALHILENPIPGPGGLAVLLGAMCFKRRKRA